MEQIRFINNLANRRRVQNQANRRRNQTPGDCIVQVYVSVPKYHRRDHGSIKQMSRRHRHWSLEISQYFDRYVIRNYLALEHIFWNILEPWTIYSYILTIGRSALACLPVLIASTQKQAGNVNSDSSFTFDASWSERRAYPTEVSFLLLAGRSESLSVDSDEHSRSFGARWRRQTLPATFVGPITRRCRRFRWGTNGGRCSVFRLPFLA